MVPVRHPWLWSLVRDQCTGCGICADVCPENAVLMTPTMPLPEPLPGRCTGCRTCVMECPFDAIVVETSSRPAV